MRTLKKFAVKKISDVGTKPTIFEQTSTETKKKFLNFFKNLSSPPELRMNNTCTCNYNENCLQHKQNPLLNLSFQEIEHVSQLHSQLHNQQVIQLILPESC